MQRKTSKKGYFLNVIRTLRKYTCTVSIVVSALSLNLKHYQQMMVDLRIQTYMDRSRSFYGEP